jgi:hypothetical protein
VRLLSEESHLIDSQSQTPELGGSKESAKSALCNLRNVATRSVHLRHWTEVRAAIGYCPPTVLNVFFGRKTHHWPKSHFSVLPGGRRRGPCLHEGNPQPHRSKQRVDSHSRPQAVLLRIPYLLKNQKVGGPLASEKGIELIENCDQFSRNARGIRAAARAMLNIH